MKLQHFLKEHRGTKKGHYRTVNLDADLHSFYKRVANHYNIALSNLLYNVLDEWKSQYQNDIKEDMINNFRF